VPENPPRDLQRRTEKPRERVFRLDDGRGHALRVKPNDRTPGDYSFKVK